MLFEPTLKYLTAIFLPGFGRVNEFKNGQSHIPFKIQALYQKVQMLLKKLQ